MAIENHTSIDTTAASEGSQVSQGSQGSVGRTLTTKGDHNPIPDRYPVTADSYLGRMLWEIDYIGAVLLFLYENYPLVIAITLITSLPSAVVTIIQWSIQFTA